MSYDPLNQLTIAELDTCSRLLKTDIVTAIHGGTMHRWQGMAILAYVLAKRTDPAAKLETYRAMTPAELSATIGVDGPPEVDETPDPEPADPEPVDDGWVIGDDDDDRRPNPKGQAVGLDAIKARAVADPTAPMRG